MVVDPKWPVTRFGVDLQRAVPDAHAEVAGAQIQRPALRNLPLGLPIAEATAAAIIFTGSGSLTTITLQALLQNFYMPEMYGAVGDGVTLDTAALQATINAAGTGTVLLSNKRYATGPLTIPLTTSIVALGGTSGASAGATFLFVPTAHDQVCLTFGPATSYGIRGGLRNFAIYSDDTTYRKIAIDAKSLDQYTIENLIIHGSPFSATGLNGRSWTGGNGKNLLVTNATNANPGFISAVGDDLVNGQLIQFTGITGMTQLNGNTYMVRDLNSATGIFTLGDATTGLPIDTTAFGVFSFSATGYCYALDCSIGIRWRSHEANNIDGLTVFADCPIVLEPNPNFPDESTTDHTNWRNLYLMATHHPCFHVIDGTRVTSTVFDGRNAFVGGTNAFYRGLSCRQITGVNTTTKVISYRGRPLINDQLISLSGLVGTVELNGNTYMVKSHGSVNDHDHFFTLSRSGIGIDVPAGQTIPTVLTAYVSGGVMVPFRRQDGWWDFGGIRHEQCVVNTINYINPAYVAQPYSFHHEIAGTPQNNIIFRNCHTSSGCPGLFIRDVRQVSFNSIVVNCDADQNSVDIDATVYSAQYAGVYIANGASSPWVATGHTFLFGVGFYTATALPEIGYSCSTTLGLDQFFRTDGAEISKGVATHADITATTNLTLPLTCRILRLNATGASRDAVGMVQTGGAAHFDGKKVTLSNIGSQNIVLKNENAGASAANRFAIGADITLTPGLSESLWYDALTTRWRLM